jgi:hypothetical protein
MIRKYIKNKIYCLCCLLPLFFSAALGAASQYQYQLSVCAIFRDDARFLKEWVEFHKIVGVEHFWLFNNLSQDGYESVLAPYIKEGTVELIEWPYESENEKEWQKIQRTAYEKSIGLARGQTKWLAVIDTDEFLFSANDNPLLKVLEGYERYGAVCVNWQLFGTSGIKRVPEDHLMIEMLTRKADTLFWKNYFIKSIVRPERVKSFPSCHWARLYGKYNSVDINKRRVKGNQSGEVQIDKLRINHYWTRDEDFFFERKISRRDKPGSNFHQLMKDFDKLNEFEDNEILRFVPLLKEKAISSASYL